MYKRIGFKIEGVCGLIMHNGQLADPLNQYSIALKEISGKRKKTDDDHRKMADIEWRGGVYNDEQGRPGIPGELIEAAFIEASKQQRLGKAAKAGLICDGFWPLEYDGPKHVDELINDQRFRDTRGVRVTTSRIMRTRPYFPKWSMPFEVDYLPSVFNEKQVREIVVTMGRMVGLGDYRPRFGRFEVV